MLNCNTILVWHHFEITFEKGYLKNWNSFIFDPLSHIFEKTEFGVHHRPQDVYQKKGMLFGKKMLRADF